MSSAARVGSAIAPPSGGARLDDWVLDERDVVRREFEAAGLVLFRGFDVDLAGFEAVTRCFSDRFVTNGAPDRRTRGHDGHTQTVTAGNRLVPPHAELSYTPFHPDTVWLHCVRPSASGGETLVCDGVAVWEQMDGAHRARFSGKRLRYELDPLGLPWLRCFLPTATTMAEAVEQLATLPGVEVKSVDEASVQFAYSCDAVPRTRYSGRPAFANSMFVDPPHTLDGRELSQVERRDVFRVVSSHIVRHEWRSGDVLMIDNSRYLHGRSAFRDESRQVVVRLGFTSSGDAPGPLIGWD